MARKSDGEKIDELQQITAVLNQRVDTLLIEAKAFANTQQKSAENLAELRRESEKEIALLKREVEELKKEREEWSRRLWAFGPNAVGAVISGLIAAVVAYLIARR